MADDLLFLLKWPIGDVMRLPLPHMADLYVRAAAWAEDHKA